MNYEHLLSVQDLHTTFTTDNGDVQAVNGVSFNLDEGKVLGIVGESGSGKSVTAYSVMQILAENGGITGGKILFKGEDITKWSESQMTNFRGKSCSIIFQDPMTSLNPVFSVGNQLMEAITLHTDKKGQAAKDRALEMLKLVGINEPEKRLKQYPFELSGGMRQRVMIACALSCHPKLLIADEPTTALDVTIQAQIMELIVKLNKELNMGVILITHDLSVVAEMCSRVAVMYLGQIVEEADVAGLYSHPCHPYTKGLLKSIPRVSGGRREELYIIEGTVPLLSQIPKGCRFCPRCPYAIPACSEQSPELIAMPSGHKVRCLRAAELQEEV